MLHIEHLTKDYGDAQGIFDLNYDCQKGEIIGLVGNNGSGKTTLIKAILQLFPVEEGVVTWNDQNIKDCFDDVAYITDSLSFIPDMTPKSYAGFMKDFYPKFNLERYFDILDHFEVNRKKRMRKMSKGQQLKVEIAAGFSQGAHLLLLDEPFSNLDVFSKQDTIKMMLSLLDDDETVLISTHNIEEIDHVIDRALILKNGKLVKDIYLEELHAQGITLKEYMNKIVAYDPNKVSRLFNKGSEQHENVDNTL